MLTASPVRKPRPEAGSTSRRTRASPVLTPQRAWSGRAVGTGHALERLEDAQAGADGALGVVLVHGGHAEDADHGVADELLDGAAVGLDHLAWRRREYSPSTRVDVLGVGGLAHRREGDEVAEEGGDDLALLGDGGWRTQAPSRTSGRRRSRRELRSRSWGRRSSPFARRAARPLAPGSASDPPSERLRQFYRAACASSRSGTSETAPRSRSDADGDCSRGLRREPAGSSAGSLVDYHPDALSTAAGVRSARRGEATVAGRGRVALPPPAAAPPREVAPPRHISLHRAPTCAHVG